MLKSEVVEVLKSIGVKASEDILEVPPHDEFGDIAFPCFEIAKIERKNPQKIAQELVQKIQVSKNPLLVKVEARGAYVNFFFYWEKISEKILRWIMSERKLDAGKKKTVMIEYSTPNPVHPIHIGHARTTFLGDSLANIFDYFGYKTIRANYMNDVGLQVAKLVTAYTLWADGKRPVRKPDVWLWNLYVKFHEEAGKDPNLEEKARDMLRKFEIEKDKKTVQTWNKVVKWCVKGFEETYRNVGVKFEKYFYENDIRDDGKEIVYDMLRKKIAFKSPEGAIVADLEKHGIANTIVLRSDETGLYLTSDLGLTVHKFEKYKLDKSIWVVSTQQNLHFKQLFKILELLGYKFVNNCHHLSFEHVTLPEGKMSSREGKAVILDEVISTLTKLAYDEVNKRNPKLAKRDKMNIAKKIGIGALKYAILKIEPESLITFDWNQMLSFEGNTGPYLQYAYTRCTSILKKEKRWKPNFSATKITTEEKRLAKELMNFLIVIEDALKQMKPHHICNYAFNLATVFNSFYHSAPVLRAEDESTKRFRLTLVEATRRVLEECFGIMGIKTVEKM